mmetsp:Transcript_9044/g.22081  ORF Transcript_9044/g.22081 Transcript_9044/m.22081 type:complete len:374 (+) Transcript_9044:54-1175(+)
MAAAARRVIVNTATRANESISQVSSSFCHRRSPASACRAATPFHRHSSTANTSNNDHGGGASSSTAPLPSSSASQSVGSYVSGSTTHFGYESVSVDEKEGRVKKVFENVADSYDVMNDFMSAGLHRYWKDELLKMTGVEPMAKAVRRRASSNYANTPVDNDDGVEDESVLSILDVAGGTGDVAFRFVDAANCEERAKSSGRDEVSVTVCDINPEMLRVGESRARVKYGSALLDDTSALKFVEGNAQHLPFEDESFDLYTIAFGLRNVTDVDMALRDALRVLKPGGRFLCLEFSHVTNVPLANLYEMYSFHVIPKLGEVVANDRNSYQYLVESIRKFCTQEELLSRMGAAGFEGVKYTNMTGGIVAVHEGWKPL